MARILIKRGTAAALALHDFSDYEIGFTTDTKKILVFDGTSIKEFHPSDNVAITGGSISGLSTDISVSDGGTGCSTLTSHGLLYGNGTDSVQCLAEATDGQIPIGDTGGVPILSTITQGDGVDIVNSAGSITVSANLKTNGGLVIESTELGIDLGASSITNSLGESKVTFADTGGHSHTGADAKGTKIAWGSIDKTTSDISDITTKSHTSLTDIGTNNHSAIDTFIGTTVPGFFNTSSGHDHDGTDSKKVSYSDLASIPSTFAPSAHASSHGSGQSDAISIANTQVSGLGTMSTQAANSVAITGGTISGLSTDLAVADGGTGSSNGSIVGTGALGFTAGGTDQNVTLTPSGAGVIIASSKIKTSGLFPASDSTTAIRLYKADGSTAVVTVDTTNTRVGIGKTPASALDVDGTVTATAFSGALTGNVTGNVSGSSGSCTGNSATASAVAASGVTAGTFPAGVFDFTDAQKLKTSGLFPASDSTTAIRLYRADGSTAVITLDTTNSLFGINCTPAKRLEVLDASTAQLRLTHTLDTDYCDFQVSTDGTLTITPSGQTINVDTGDDSLLVWTKSNSTHGVTIGSWHVPLDIKADIEFWATALVPHSDNTTPLGSTSYRWSNVYATKLTSYTTDSDMAHHLRCTNVASTGGYHLSFNRALDGTTAVVDGRTLGQIDFYGYQNGDYRLGAYIVGEVDGTPSGNYVPGKISFYTGTASAAPVEHMIIDSEGDVEWYAATQYTPWLFCVNDSNDGGAAQFSFRKRRNGAAVQDGDDLGWLNFEGWQNGDFRDGGWVGMVCGGAPSGNYLSTYMDFWVSSSSDGDHDMLWMEWDYTNTVAPGSNATLDLGHTSYRWDNVYCVAVSESSDANLKENIIDVPLGLDFVNRLRPRQYKFKDTVSESHSKDKKGNKKTTTITHSRKHTGLIAQEVKQVLDDLVISTNDFAGYIDGGEGGLSLRYTEFIAPIIKAIQELSVRVEALESA